MTSGQAPRQNRDGHPCPPWCVVEHDQQLMPGYFNTSHAAESVRIHLTSVRAVLQPAVGNAKVQVCTPGRGGGSVFLEATTAGYLAVLIEELADATPDQYRELAAAIRKAAADITSTDGAQP